MSKELSSQWERLGETDPLWAILTAPDKKGSRWEVEEFFRTGEEEVEGALAYLDSLGLSPKKGRALDFGCGVGRLTQALARHFDEVSGVDAAASMIELAEKHNRRRGNCRYFLNRRWDLGIFPDAGFDFVYSRIVLQHMKPKYALGYLAEFGRLLAPGGVLLFQLPGGRKAGGSLAAAVRKVVPRVVIDTLFSLRIRAGRLFDDGPHMDMYGIERERVTGRLAGSGLRMVGIRDEQWEDSVWESLLYCAVKDRDGFP